MKFELLRFRDSSELAEAAAHGWISQIRNSTTANKPLLIAISGGRIAGRFFDATTAQAKLDPLVFGRAEFFWADERCVPPTDNESNFKLANDRLLLPLQIKPRSIHRIRGELNGDRAAAEAERELREVARAESGTCPVIDLVLLGMGEDGHVASLFPHTVPPTVQNSAVYRSVIGPKPPPRRVTLDYRPIFAAQHVWVLASGPDKSATLKESLDPLGQTPLAQVIRNRSITRIYTDIQMV